MRISSFVPWQKLGEDTDQIDSLLGFIYFDGIGEKPCAEHHELNSSEPVHPY